MIYNRNNREDLFDKDLLLKILSEHGYIQLNSFVNLEDFKNFTDSIGISFRGYNGAGFSRESALNDNTLLNVNAPHDYGGSTLHGEQYYLPNPPGILFFFCNKEADLNGETLLCKGTELLNALPKRLQTKLIEQSIIYKRRFTKEQWNRDIIENPLILKAWNYKEEGDFVWTEFKTKGTWKSPGGQNAFINSILPMLFDFEDTIMEIVFEDGTIINKELGKIILSAAESIQIKKLLKKNEAIIVDNRWVLHGRTPFTGQREMFTRMSSINIFQTAL